MSDSGARVRQTIPEEIMLARLAQSEQMREFFIQVWKQNPSLAKQGGIKVQNLMTQLVGGDSQTFSPNPSFVASAKQRGVSLIELVMFIVIISVAVTGVLLVMNKVTGHSADTLVRKQALAIAESLLEEVELMPFTYCDPDDPTATTAASAVLGVGGCTVRVESLGLDTAFAPYQVTDEARYSNTTPFDNVNDYNGCQMNTGVTNAGCDSTGTGGIKDIAGAVINDPAGNPIKYKAVVDVVADALGSITQASGDALRITVTVCFPSASTCPDLSLQQVVLDGYRTRYAPNGVP